MKVLVCGGRKFHNIKAVYDTLDSLAITTVIHGCASGADSIASDWAKERGVPEHRFPANWTKHGKAAGVIRNSMMLKEGKPELVIAFPGGTGTADMIKKTKANGLPVMEVK